MQTLKKLFWTVLPFIAACSGVDVQTDYDAAADFSRYKTYYWAKTPTTRNPIMAGRIVADIDGQLYAKGWRKAPEGQADAAVAAHVTTRENERIDTVYNNMGPGGWYGYGWYGPWVGGGMSTTLVTHYTIGTLIVDIFDAKSKKGIWHGTAEGTVTADNLDNQKKLNEAIQKMFQAFPPSGVSGAPMR